MKSEQMIEDELASPKRKKKLKNMNNMI